MLQKQTIEPATYSLLKELMQLKVLNRFSLVGGTALALILGHRKSIDLDLFSSEPFDSSALCSLLESHFGNRIKFESTAKWGIFCFIDDTKVDIVYYPHPTIDEIKTVDCIRLYSIKDIAAMKINAILGRGNKKDFYDIAALLNKFSLEEVINFYNYKFPNQRLLISIPQALIYFEDAEKSVDPISLHGQTWNDVKKSIQQGVKDYLV